MDIGEMIFMVNKCGFSHFEGEYHINFDFEIYFERGSQAEKGKRDQIIVTKYFKDGKLSYDLTVAVSEEILIAEKALDVAEFTKTFYSALMSFTIKDMATNPFMNNRRN